MPISATSNTSSLQLAASTSAPPPLQAALAGDASFGCIMEWACAPLAASTNYYLFHWPGVLSIRYQTADDNLRIGVKNTSDAESVFAAPVDDLQTIAAGSARVLVAVDFDSATDQFTIRWRSTNGSALIKSTSVATFPQPWSLSQNANFALPGAMTDASASNICARGVHGPMLWLDRPITDDEFEAFWAEPFGEILRAIPGEGIDEADVAAVYHRVVPSVAGAVTTSSPMRIYRATDASPTRWDTRNPSAATSISVASRWPNSAASTPSLEPYAPEDLPAMDIGGLAAPVAGIAPAAKAFLANEWDAFDIGLWSNSRGARGFPSPCPHAGGTANSTWASGMWDAMAPTAAGLVGFVRSLLDGTSSDIVPVLLTFGAQSATGGGAYPSLTGAWSEGALSGTISVTQQSDARKRLGLGSVDGTNGPGVGHTMAVSTVYAMTADLLAGGSATATCRIRRGMYKVPGLTALTVTRQKKVFATSVWTDVGDAEVVDMDSSVTVAVWDSGTDSVATTNTANDTLVFGGEGHESRNMDLLALAAPGMLVQHGAQGGLFEIASIVDVDGDVRVVMTTGGLNTQLDGKKVSIGPAELVFFDWETGWAAQGSDSFAFRLTLTSGTGDSDGAGSGTRWPFGPRGGAAYAAVVGTTRPLYCWTMGWGGYSFTSQVAGGHAKNLEWIADQLDMLVCSDASQGVSGFDAHRDNFLVAIDAAASRCDVVLLDDTAHTVAADLFGLGDEADAMIAGGAAAARLRRVPMLATRNAAGDLVRQDALGWRQDGSHPYVGAYSHALFSALESASEAGAFLTSMGTARVERIRSDRVR